ncbi:MAG: hypothetical protein IJU56_05475 [Clostridia bacterium]|nr:hypothetical protein [Clostridia bacterium]
MNQRVLYFGDDALSFLPQELKNYGPRVMLTYGGGYHTLSREDVIGILKESM